MKHKSLDDKSSLSDGLSHRCVDCLIKHLCCQGGASGTLSLNVYVQCSVSYREGYKKGYKQHQKESR